MNNKDNNLMEPSQVELDNASTESDQSDMPDFLEGTVVDKEDAPELSEMVEGNRAKLLSVSYVCAFIRENEGRINFFQNLMEEIGEPRNPFTLGVNMILQGVGKSKLLKEYKLYMAGWCPAVKPYDSLVLLNRILEDGVEHYSTVKTVHYRGKDSL